MKKELREKAVYLRTQKRMSYGAIKKQLGVSKSTLSYWLKDFPLSASEILELRRKGWSQGEASREKYRQSMRKKKECLDDQVYEKEFKKLRNISKESFYVAGLVLYIGEGAKTRESSLVLANSDPKLIRFFMNWLEEFLDVRKKDVRIQLHLYENMDISKEKSFWTKYLNVNKDQFYKISVRKLKKGSFSYANSYKHGTCSLYAFGVSKVRKVRQASKALLDVYNL